MCDNCGDARYRSICGWCDRPHYAPAGYACLQCHGPLVPLFDPVRIEADEDPDQRPYIWE